MGHTLILKSEKFQSDLHFSGQNVYLEFGNC